MADFSNVAIGPSNPMSGSGAANFPLLAPRQPLVVQPPPQAVAYTKTKSKVSKNPFLLDPEMARKKNPFLVQFAPSPNLFGINIPT